MKLVEKALLYKPRTAAAPVTWASYVTALAPPAWWRMRDTSGTTVVNSGSLGSAVDLTAIAWTMAQAGQLGSGEAGQTDGATTRLQTPNNVALAGLTAWEFVFLVNPSSAGEIGYGVFFEWGNNTPEPLAQFNGVLTSLRGYIYNTAPTAFFTQTTSGLTAGVWALLFFAYNDAGDRKLHIYKGVSGGVAEFGYSSQLAVTGTYKAPTSALNLLNRTGQDLTYAGLCDEALIINGNLTPTQRSTLCTLSGV